MKCFCAQQTSGSFERMQQKVQERRMAVERARSMTVNRIHEDLQRIAKREVSFAQKLIEEIIPVKVSWNQEAWEKMQESMPLRVQKVNDVVEPEVVPEGTAPSETDTKGGP